MKYFSNFLGRNPALPHEFPYGFRVQVQNFRGIFHTKDESLSSEGYHRLHVLCGESLCSHLGAWLKVGTTALVVAMIDAGLRPGDGVRLKSPLSAMQTFASDPQCKATVLSARGKRLTAHMIQRHYLEQAEALRDGAKKGWDNARDLVDNPQELNGKIIAAQGQLMVAEQNVEVVKKFWDDVSREYEASLREARAALSAADHQVQQARINLEQAESLKLALLPPVSPERWIRPPSGVQNELQYDLNLLQVQSAQEALDSALANREIAQSRLERLLSAPTLVDNARGQYGIAQVSYDMAIAVLDDLLATRNNPLALKNQADSAETHYKQAMPAVEVSRAALDAVLAGATTEQINVARAQVRQSEATAQLLRTQKEKMTITCPASGTVSEKAVRAGEVVVPGAPILIIINLETVTLKVYIPEIQIGQLKLGGAAYVSVDSYPGRKFQGRITYISPQAEFTPKNIQTQEERVKTVFAVKITVDNPEGILKPGLPADAILELI